MNTPKRLEWTVTDKVPLTHDVDGNPILNIAGEPLPFKLMIEVTRIRPEVLKMLEEV